MTTVLIITGIVIAVIAAMNFIKTKPKEEKSMMDVLEESPKYQEMKGLFDMISVMNEGGTELDTIPDGYGEFGHDITNPIPVNTVMGSIAYLGRLRTTDGQKVQYDRLGSTGTENIDKPIDMYKISVQGRKIATLHVSPYHKKNSDRPPKGFKLSPLP